LRKEFKLDRPFDRAIAVATCDNSFVLYVNNKLVTQGDNWHNLASVPLGGFLREGSNSLVVVAGNGGAAPNAAGFYLDARIHFADGTESTIVTDATWSWGDKPPVAKEGHIGAIANANWRPATVVRALASWTKVVNTNVPALLAQGAASDPHMVRAALLKGDFLMRTLGRPNRDQIVSMRPNDLTTLEAIDLANGQALADALAKGARKLAADQWPDVDAFITHLYKSALTRRPTPGELASLREALGGQLTEQGVQDALWIVCMMPEFQFVR